MSSSDLPHVARLRFPGEPNKAERDACAKDVVERAKWFTSREGRRRMTEKCYYPSSGASGMIQDVLDLAGERGMSPLQVFSSALLNYSASQGIESPEIEELRAFPGCILDRADARENPDPAETV